MDVCRSPPRRRATPRPSSANGTSGTTAIQSDTHGFAEFKGYVSGNVDFFSHVDGAGRFDWWHGAEQSDEPGYVTTLINQHAVRFINERGDEPFCLYLAHEAPHFPLPRTRRRPGGFRKVGGFSGRQELSDEQLKQKYYEMVAEMDRGVGAVLETLSRRDIAERTLVLFFSDNGATPDGSNGALRGHKGSVWEGRAPRAGHRMAARRESKPAVRRTSWPPR